MGIFMKLKHLFAGFLAAVGILTLSTVAMAENDTISVMVDNEEVVFDQAPTIIEGRTLVPIRAVFEKAGSTVDWEQDTLTAVIERNGITVRITLDKDIMFKNGKAVALDVPAKIINDRTLIPVRAISDA